MITRNTYFDASIVRPMSYSRVGRLSSDGGGVE